MIMKRLQLLVLLLLLAPQQPTRRQTGSLALPIVMDTAAWPLALRPQPQLTPTRLQPCSLSITTLIHIGSQTCALVRFARQPSFKVNHSTFLPNKYTDSIALPVQPQPIPLFPVSYRSTYGASRSSFGCLQVPLPTGTETNHNTCIGSWRFILCERSDRGD